MTDRSLLDRLNALKPSTVTLERNSRPEGIAPSATSDPLCLNPLPSDHPREDALTSRLRLLRNGGLSRSHSESPAANTDPSQPPTVPLSAADSLSGRAAGTGGVDRHHRAASQSPQAPNTLQEEQHDPYTLNEEALDDLLEGLNEDDFDLADVDFHPSTLGRTEEGEDQDAHTRPNLDAGGPDGPDDDDSDAEPMRRDVDKILSQMRDELAQDKDANPGPDPGAEATDVLHLPTVPQQLPDLPTTADAEADRKSLDFENDITVRLASLRGLGSGVNLDPFGLPVAPTFRPADRAPTKKKGAGGYTDEDQKTWCVACLDDATIRCVGCDGDVFCSRCWREMHLGPSAGYDDRGHQWVRFERS